jgi:hypothetical protein
MRSTGATTALSPIFEAGFNKTQPESNTLAQEA